MACGTPPIAYRVDNLVTLIGAGGVLVPTDEGPEGLWRAAGRLLDDPARYEVASSISYSRAQDYRSARVADQLLKVLS
jgi:glycosyltransferase involved in cell wall biosynthesis